uniref:Uncharacterized protein n=1 Tax=Anopheles epiroticus TaxID=199890 RepID=A0A182PIR2_9DIPT
MILMQIAVGVAAGMSVTVSSRVRVSSLMVSIDCWMVSMTHSLHVSLEAVVLVGRVLDHSLGSISLIQSVRSLDNISIPMFPLALVVSGVGILHSILELVARMRMVVLMLVVVGGNGDGQQGKSGNGDLHHGGRIAVGVAAGMSVTVSSRVSVSSLMVSIDCWMVSMTHSLHVSLEAVVLVGRVLDHSLGSISLIQIKHNIQPQVMEYRLFSMMILMQDAVGVAAGMSVTVSSRVRVSSFMVSIDCWMVSMTHTLHVSLEAVVLVGGVLDHSLGSISLIQSVLSRNDHRFFSMMILMQIAVGVAAGMSVTVSSRVRVSSLMVSIDCWMVSMTHTLHVSLEAVVLVGRVLDHSLGSISLIQSIAVGVAAGMSVTMSAIRMSSLMMSIDCWMISMTHSLHMSLEAVVLVGRVLNHSLSSVGFIQSVRSLDDISIPMFPLALVVSGVGILHAILELIALLLAMAVAVFGYGHEHQDYHSHPSYKFEYGVKDPHTGDHKSQWEHRDGDVVKGAYTLDEADGTKRLAVAVAVSMTIRSTISTLISIDFRVMGMTHSLHMSLEAVVLVGRVLDHSLGSISLIQSVRSLDDISIPMFPLALVVSAYGDCLDQCEEIKV